MSASARNRSISARTASGVVMAPDVNRRNPISQAECSYWKNPIRIATIPDMEGDIERNRLAALIAERGADLKAISLAIGRNHAYLQQYLKKGVPRHLPPAVRGALARHLRFSAEEVWGADPYPLSNLDLLLFTVRHTVPECGAQFQIPIRRLVARNSVSCPS